MREGRVLFVNELDRMPEPVQNVLLPVLDEGVLLVPHVGLVRAAAGFQVLATRNPEERVAAGRLSEALRDRFERLALSYQSLEEELAIVRAELPGIAGGAGTEFGTEIGAKRGTEAGVDAGTGAGVGAGGEDAAAGDDDAAAALVRAAVLVTRGTRRHPLLRRGSSVRGAVALASVAAGLDGEMRARLRRAADAALTTRVEPDGEEVDLAAVFDELVELVAGRGQDPDDVWPPRDGRPAGPQTADAARARRGRPGAGERPEPGACATAVAAATDARAGLAAQLRVPVGELDGWDVAARLADGSLAGAGVDVVSCAQRLAAAVVLRRAARLVGPLRGSTHLKLEALREPYEGDLAVEATLENIAGKEWPEPTDWVVERRVERRHQVVLMVDMSLSMAGEKAALAAVATAVMALKLHDGDLAVVLFARRARTVARLREELPASEIVRRMLAHPCAGPTNVAAALELGFAELQRGRAARRSAVLISDGVYTAGGDPRAAAARFSALHVLLTHDDAESGPRGGATWPSGGASRPRGEVWVAPHREAGHAVARAGGGRVVPVAGFRALPRRMLDLADHVLR